MTEPWRCVGLVVWLCSGLHAATAQINATTSEPALLTSAQAALGSSSLPALWPQLRIAVDTQAAFTPEQAWQHTQAADALPLRHANQVLSAPNGPPHWAGFSVRQEVFGSSGLWLSLKSPTQDHSRVWLRVDGQGWQAWPDMQQSGEGSYLFPMWHLPMPAHQLDVLVRLQGVNRVQFPLDLQTPQAFAQQHWRLMLLMGAVLAVPLMLVMFALSLMPHLRSPTLWLFVLMAMCEVLCASWISGLLCLLWPALGRAQAALLGSFSYWVLFVASIHHARLFLDTAQRHPLAHQVLNVGAWLWYVLVPLCVLVQPNWLRSLLLWGGSLHALGMMVLAWRSWRLSPSTQRVLFASMWLVYVLSAVVYWLYRWLEWPLLTTLGVQFVQGALMASLMGWSACLQVIQQRMALQRSVSIAQARHRWYAAAQHDLWQPLQSMQMFAKALLKASPEKRSSLVAAMQLASQSVDDFMQHLRYWAKEEPPAPLDIPRTDVIALADLLQDLMDEFQPLASMRHVVLRHPRCKARVRVNVQAVQRMLRNLLSNALQYTPAGGRVLLGCKRQDGLLWILCMDNGSGMNSQAAQDCFNAFTRLAPDDEGAHHLGLGLFSVKQLALQHQMPTRLHSIEGRGTVIGFGVPLSASDNIDMISKQS